MDNLHPSLIRRARSIAFGFIILSCGREKDSLTNVLVSSCTCQDTLPLLSKGGNQGALVLVKLDFQTSSPFFTDHFVSYFHLNLFNFNPRPLSHSCFSCELFLRAFHISLFSFNLEPCNSHRREPKEGQVSDSDPGDDVQHPSLQPQPLQRAPDQLGVGDDQQLSESLPPSSTQEVAQQRFGECWLPISHAGVLPHG